MKSEGDIIIGWIEAHCRVPSGTMTGRPLKLAPFQRQIIKGVYDEQIRRAIISFGRKSGKTTLCALLMLVELCGPRSRQNGRLFSTALSRGQAALLFDLARDVVRQSPELSAAITVREAAKELLCPERGTVYKALSADAGINLGLSPNFTIHDELGQSKGPRNLLFEALESATAAQENPLSIIISTQAPDSMDLLSILIDDAAKGVPGTKLFLWEAGPELDPFSDEALRAANPAFDYFINRDELRRMAADAKRLPSAEADFRNKNLNQRVSLTSPFISESVWRACAGEVDEDVFRNSPVTIGADLSKRADLTALACVARDKDGIAHVLMLFFTPEVGIEERSRRDSASYDLWSRQGFIEATPGASVDLAIVAQRLIELCDTMNVTAIAYDRWRMDILKAELKRLGREDLPLVEFGQGYKSFSPAIDTLESELLNGRIRHGGNPVLEMCAKHAVITGDAAGNRKLDKSKATSRIDGVVALCMGLAVLPEQNPAPKYELFFV